MNSPAILPSVPAARAPPGTTHRGRSCGTESRTRTVTSLESTPLADPLPWGKARARGAPTLLETDTTDTGKERSALQVVCLALHYSMRHYGLRFHAHAQI